MWWTLVFSLFLCSSPAWAQTASYFSDGVVIDRGAIQNYYDNQGTMGTIYTPLPGGPTYYQFSGPGGQHRSGTIYTPQAPESSQLPLSPLPEYHGARHGIYTPMEPFNPGPQPGHRPW